MVVSALCETKPTEAKRKLLPFESDFDSEYDYSSEEYNYLSLEDIQNAVYQPTRSKAKNQLDESIRTTTTIIPVLSASDQLFKATPSLERLLRGGRFKREVVFPEEKIRIKRQRRPTTTSATSPPPIPSSSTPRDDSQEMSSTTRRTTRRTTTPKENSDENSKEMSSTTRRTTKRTTTPRNDFQNNNDECETDECGRRCNSPGRKRKKGKKSRERNRSCRHRHSKERHRKHSGSGSGSKERSKERRRKSKERRNCRDSKERCRN